MNARTWMLAAASLAAAPAMACEGAGVITRIEGRPQDVVISRPNVANANVRPRVLDAVCAGDVVAPRPGTTVHLSLDGKGAVIVKPPTHYTVGGRTGAPSLAGNAYRMLVEVVMPDMKRLAWDVRLRGEVTPFGLAAPVKSGAALAPGRREVLLRLVGGQGPFRAELTDAAGAQVGATSGETRDLVLKTEGLKPGPHRLKLADAAGGLIELDLSVEPAPAGSELGDVADPEVRAAIGAVELAKLDPAKWTLEAQQRLAEAPRGGLDRERVFQLLETYGVD